MKPTPSSAKTSNLVTQASRDISPFDIATEDHIMREIVDEALAQGVRITRMPQLSPSLLLSTLLHSGTLHYLHYNDSGTYMQISTHAVGKC